MRSHPLASLLAGLFVLLLGACSATPDQAASARRTGPGAKELGSLDQGLDLLASGAAGWVATGGATVGVDASGRLWANGPGALTKTLNGANRVNLTAEPTLSVRAVEANALFNLFCAVSGSAAGSFLRSNAPGQREAVVAPPGAGLKDVTLTLFLTSGSHIVFDRMGFIADASSAQMPSAPVFKSGNMRLDIPLDAAEAARWSFAPEEAGQDVQVSAQGGKLVFDGRGMVRRVFLVDLQQLPNLSVAMSASSGSPQPVFNLGTYVNDGARVEFLRSDEGPKATWKAMPDAGTGPGLRRVTVEILFTGGHHELSSLSFQGNYQELDLLANGAAGWTTYGGATFSVDANGNLVAHGPPPGGSGNGGLQRFLTGANRVNMTTYPALSVRATSVPAIFNLFQQVGTNPGVSFMRSSAPSAREAVIAAPQAGEQNVTLALGLAAGVDYVFDRIRLTSNTTSAEMPAAVEQGGVTHVDVPLDASEANRWSFVPEAADHQLKIRGVDGKLIFDGKGIAKRVFWVDLAQTPQLLANMSAVTGSPLPVFNLGTSVDDTARTQFLRSDDGPRSIQATISNAGAGTGLRKVEMDIIFTGGHFEMSQLDFTEQAPPPPVLDAFADVASWQPHGGTTIVKDAQGRAVVTAGNGASGDSWLSKTFNLDMTTLRSLAVKASAVNGKLFNIIYVMDGAPREVSLLRTDQPAERVGVIAPENAGTHSVTLRIGLESGGLYTFDYLRFSSDATPAVLPARTVVNGREVVHPALDAQEAARWHITRLARENQDLQVTVENGKLVFNGHGTAERTFFADLTELPALLLSMTSASSTFVVETRVGDEDIKQFMRSTSGPMWKEDLILANSYTPGQRRVVVSIRFAGVGAHYELADFQLSGPKPPLGPAPPQGVSSLPPPASGQTDSPLASYVPASGASSLNAAIWKANGCLAAGWYGASGQKIMSFSGDVYRFLPQSSAQAALEAYEVEDVCGPPQAQAGASLFSCTNPKLPGVAISKRYARHATAPGVITKRMAFTTSTPAQWNGLFYWESVANLDPAFRSAGIYYNTDYHPLQDAFFEASRIITDKQQPYRQQVVFYNRAQEITVGHHRMEINDKVIGQQVGIPEHESDRTHFTNAGWRFFALADRLSANAASATVHYAILSGDMTHYHRLMQSLPEFQAGNSIESDAQWKWVGQVKGNAPPAIFARSNVNAEAAAWDILLEEGYGVRGMTGVMDVSDYDIEGTWTPWGAAPNSMSESMLDDMISAAHTHPRAKIGPYDYFWSVETNSALFAAHADDWFLRKRSNDYDEPEHVFDQIGMVTRFFTPQHVDWLAGKTSAIMNRFAFDYFYLDGGGFGETQVDWPTMRVVQPVDSFTPLTKALTTTVGANRRPAFVNASNGLYNWNQPMGFYEGFVKPYDWRALSIKLMEVKLYQQPGTWFMPLRATEGDMQRYVNYCTLLGTKADLTLERKELAILNTLYELDPLRIQDVGLTPRWYTAPVAAPSTGVLEAYALGFDRRQLLISMLNHDLAGDGDVYEVRFDAAKTSMDPQRETYVFGLRPEPPSLYRYNRLSEPEDRVRYEGGSELPAGKQAGWSPIALAPRAEVEVRNLTTGGPNQRNGVPLPPADSMSRFVRPDQTEHLVITQTPGLVWATNGHRKYLPLSETRWGKLSGGRAGDTISLVYDTKRTESVQGARVEVAIIVPSDWQSVTVEVNGVPETELSGGVQRPKYRRALPDLVIVGPIADAHDQQIVVHKANPVAPGIDLEDAQVTLDNAGGQSVTAATAGDDLTLDVSFAGPLTAAARAHINVSRDATPVFTSPAIWLAAGAQGLTHPLDIPAELPPAQYVVRVAVEGAGQIELPLEVKRAALTYPAGWQNGSYVPASVNWTNGPFTVTSRFRQVSSAGSYTTDVTAPSRLEVRSGASTNAGYAYAALEFASLSAVTAVGGLTADNRAAFAGDAGHLSISVDYHVSGGGEEGYKRRVYFNGTSHGLPQALQPAWGVNSSQATTSTEIQSVDYRSQIFRGDGLGWNLTQYAPANWDGRVILGANLYAVEPNTILVLNLSPRALYSANSYVNLALYAPSNGVACQISGFGQGQGTYCPASSPLVPGSTTTLDSSSGQPSIFAVAGNNQSSFLSMLAPNTLSLRVDAEGSGDTVLVADYLVAGELTGRAVLVLSTSTTASQVRTLVQAAPWFRDYAGPVAAYDVRAIPDGWIEFAEYAPAAWSTSLNTRMLLLHAGAIGPQGTGGASSQLELRMLDMRSQGE